MAKNEVDEISKALDKATKDADKADDAEMKELERLHKISMRQRSMEEDPTRQKAIDKQTRSLFQQIAAQKAKIAARKGVSFKL